MTQNEIALKILNMGKDGYKDDTEGFEKLNKANKLIDEHVTEQLRLYSVVGSLPIQDLPNCTRVEVIDQKGRSYVNWKPTNKVRLSMQDDGRTAKIFID